MMWDPPVGTLWAPFLPPLEPYSETLLRKYKRRYWGRRGEGRGGEDKDEDEGDMFSEWPWWGKTSQREFEDALANQDSHTSLE